MFNFAGVKAYQLGVASTEAFEVALYWRGVDCFQTRGLWSATECLGDSLLLSFPWDFTFTKALQNFVLIIDYTHLPSLQCLDYYYYTHNVLLQILYRAEKKRSSSGVRSQKSISSWKPVRDFSRQIVPRKISLLSWLKFQTWTDIFYVEISDIRLHFRGGACHSCCYFYPPNAIFSSIQLFKQFLDSFRPTLCKS